MKVPVRALVHGEDAHALELAAQGAEVVHGDLTDFDSVSKALTGISYAYFLYPIQVPGIVEATAYFAQAAIEAGVSGIVNMSQITARRDSKSHAALNHWISERLLDRSGIPVTHLRPTLFAEWLMYVSGAIKGQNILPLAFGDARYAPIAGEDLGRVVATILSDPGKHAGKSYPLYGPKELSEYEVADMLSSVSGRKIAYVPLTIEAFSVLLKDMGFNEYFRQHISAVAQDCRDGVCSGTNDLVEQLTGEPPLGMLEWITRNRALFATADEKTAELSIAS
jgi:uncharacterized protein YbjT (DUF2867 family)